MKARRKLIVFAKESMLIMKTPSSNSMKDYAWDLANVVNAEIERCILFSVKMKLYTGEGKNNAELKFVSIHKVLIARNSSKLKSERNRWAIQYGQSNHFSIMRWSEMVRTEYDKAYALMSSSKVHDIVRGKVEIIARKWNDKMAAEALASQREDKLKIKRKEKECYLK